MKPHSGLIAVVFTVLTGCAPDNLYVAHETVLGINASVNQGRQQGQLVVGYDRDFATVIPTTVPDPSQGGKRDAMALVNCTFIEIDGIWLNGYSDVMATGEAAKELARNDGLPADEFKCDE